MQGTLFPVISEGSTGGQAAGARGRGVKCQAGLCHLHSTAKASEAGRRNPEPHYAFWWGLGIFAFIKKDIENIFYDCIGII